MKKEYISPYASIVNILTESHLMQASSPSFGVDNSQESDIALSSKNEGSYWNESSWNENSSAE